MTTRLVATSGEKEWESPTAMKAMVISKYGAPDVLQMKDIPMPPVQPDSAVVRVRATSVNPADLHAIHGPLITRFSSGWRRPKKTVPGADVAGVVEAVGENVAGLQPGDDVFGTCGASGTLAEFTRGAKNLVPKPANLTFEQAAALPIAGITALQALRDYASLQAGQTVLINGAAGGVGTFAVQIAKAFGAEVTAVCSTRNVDLARSIGADHVIDYSQQDFARSSQRWNVVLDTVGNRSLSDLRRATEPEGKLILVGGGHDRGHGGRGMLRPLMLAIGGTMLSRFVKPKAAFFIAKINKDDLLVLKSLCEEGKVTPVLDRTFSLPESAEAFRYLEAGHARGKVVISV